MKVLSISSFNLFMIPVAVLLLGTFSESAQAQTEYQREQLMYYEIGGASAARPPASYRHQRRIRGDGSLSLGYSCGSFDLRSNLRGMFDRFQDQLDGAVDSLMYAATGAVASLPLYLLRQANPGLANMLEGMMLRYEEEFRLGVKSCQEAEAEILRGENPYLDWVSVGQHDTWQREAGSGRSVDQIRERVDDRHGCVTWIGGVEYFCDDRDTRQIPVYESVATEGYHLLEDEPSDVPDGAAPSRLKAYWPTADDAVEDILAITGETVITNARRSPPSAQPPRGLSADLHEETAELTRQLTDVVDDLVGPQEPEVWQQRLGGLGVPGLEVTPVLVRGIQSLEPETRPVAIARIASEIALLRSMEKVNLARRVILAGSRVPEVEASPARDLIREEALPLLEMEARLLQDEYDLRSRAASSTAALIVRARFAKENREISETIRNPGTGRTPAPTVGGRVLP